MTELSKSKNTEAFTEELLQNTKDVKGRNLYFEVHRLIAPPASAMNCDMNGDVKKINYGGYVRTLLSSQSIKRALREKKNDCVEQTKYGPYDVMIEIVKNHPEMSEDYKNTMYAMVGAALNVQKDRAGDDLKKMEFDKNGREKILKTPQLLHLSEEDTKFIAQKAIEVFPEDICQESVVFEEKKDKEGKKRLVLSKRGKELVSELVSTVKKLRNDNKVSVGQGISMFGRMSTSQIIDSVDNATMFADAFSVGEYHGDIDTFTAVETFKKFGSLFESEEELDEGNAGAGHLGTREIAAGCMYFYNNFELRTLIENEMKGIDCSDTEAVETRLKETIDNLLTTIELNVCILPNGKKNAMFGHVRPEAVYITCTQGSPFSRANLYAEPVRATRDKSESDIAVELLAKSINTTSAYDDGGTTYTKQYWISDKYKDSVKSDATTTLDMIEDLRAYLYEQFGINA